MNIIRTIKIIMAVVMLFIITAIVISSLLYETTNKPVSKKYIVVVDPGHGGNDPGKVGINGELEKDINLEISKKLKKSLEEQGVSVIMTREEDVCLAKEGVSNKKVSDLKERISIIEKEKADMLVSIHQNSFNSGNAKGAQVFYYSKSEEGKKLAKIIQSVIKQKVDISNKRSEKAGDDYFMLINSKCPAVIVECGFLSNMLESRKLSDKDYQQQLADGIATAVVLYIQQNKAIQ